jgi:hypothetical protein
MSNLLFSSLHTKSIVIVTPEFLDINYRFKYSIENTDITYFFDVELYKEKNKIPLFTRVNINDGIHKNKIGEIIEYNSDSNTYLIHISNNEVAGFNNEIQFEKIELYDTSFSTLDNGLNSPYSVNIDYLMKLIQIKKT